MKPKKFSIKFRVYFSDTDAVGIVYHANYLDFAERARTELVRECGLDLISFSKRGEFFVVRKAELEYISPSRLDDMIEVEAYIESMGKTSVTFKHEIFKIEKGERVKVCDVSCLLVFVKMEKTGPKPTHVPEEIKSSFFH